MNLQFTGYVPTMGDDRMDGNIQRFGYFLVRHALYHAGDDFLFTLAKVVRSCFFFLGHGNFFYLLVGMGLRNLLFQLKHGRHKEIIFHFVVRSQIFLTVEDVEEDGIHHVGLPAVGIILDDAILQFGQLLVDVVVMTHEHVDVVVLALLAFQQLIDVRKHVRVFVTHVVTHFLYIVVEKCQDEEGHFIVHRAVNGFEEFPTDGGKLEIEEIVVGILQIGHQRFHRNVVYGRRRTGMALVDEIGYGQESTAIYLMGKTDFFHRIVTKTQGKAKTAHHLQQAIIVADDVSHFVVGYVYMLFAHFINTLLPWQQQPCTCHGAHRGHFRSEHSSPPHPYDGSPW